MGTFRRLSDAELDAMSPEELAARFHDTLEYRREARAGAAAAKAEARAAKAELVRMLATLSPEERAAPEVQAIITKLGL